MAIRPDWNIGTITLTASSADFTTTGALLETAAIEPGDAIITPSGAVLVISSITGQDSGTLMLPCPAGAAGTNMPLRIRFQPDGSRFQAAYKAAAYLLSGGNVEALAGLAGENGKLPIFTGAGTMGLVDKGDVGIQDPNGNLADLAGLTLAARQILQTDANGELGTIALAANKFLRTDGNADLTQGDLTALGAALLSLTGTNGNIPVMTGAGSVARRPIVGAVSQSGGIPTGAILESGSNSNGHYKKRADGTMMCRGFASAPCNTSSGPVFISDYIQFTFPAAFVAIPYIAYGVERTAGNGVVWPTASSADLSETGVSCRGAATISGAWARIYYIAEGRWF